MKSLKTFFENKMTVDQLYQELGGDELLKQASSIPQKRMTRMAYHDHAAHNRHGELKQQMRYSPEEHNAILSYQKSSVPINTPNYYHDLPEHPDDKHLSAAIKRHALPRKSIIYHGVSTYKFNMRDHPKNFEGNYVVSNPGYLSTTVFRPTAQIFSNKGTQDIIKIHAPKGSHVGIAFSGEYSNERELILHKGHVLHVHPKPTVLKHGHKIWHARLVHDGVHDLNESWKLNLGATYRGKTHHWYGNDDEVGGHHVSIDFSHLDDGHYGIAFTKNHEMDDFDQDAHSGKAIYHHVYKKINQFIRARRPKSLSYSAFDPKMDKMYRKMGERIAKKYGARFLPDDESDHMILFDKKKLDENWRIGTHESPRYPEGRKFADHVKQIDGHEVAITFGGSGVRGETEGHYSVNYTVNGSYNRETIDRNTGKQILHHVGKRLDSFIRHMKPKSLTMVSDKDKKISLHHHLTKRLSRKYGGVVKTYYIPHLGMTRHEVHFNKEKLEEAIRISNDKFDFADQAASNRWNDVAHYNKMNYGKDDLDAVNYHQIDSAHDGDELLKTISKSKMHTNQIVYHGAGFDPSHLPKNERGHHVLRPKTNSFSTTLSALRGYSYAKPVGGRSVLGGKENLNVIKFKLPQGAHAATGDPDHEYSGENEFILHPKSEIHIHPTPIERHMDNGRKVKVWRARLVHDGINKLDERVRTPEEATKLGVYLTKRHYKQGVYKNPDRIRFKSYQGETPEFHRAIDKLDDYSSSKGMPSTLIHLLTPTTDLDIGKLVPTQPATAFRAKEAKRKLKDDEPIEVIKHNNKHYVLNGHHRWIAHRLLGKPTIKARVIDLDEAISYKPENFKDEKHFRQKHFENIDGHQIEVSITGYDGHHNANYYINGSPKRKGKAASNTRQQILGFIHKTLVNHLNTHKPESLTLAGDTKKKRKFYSNYINRLARNTDGKYRSREGVDEHYLEKVE